MDRRSFLRSTALAVGVGVLGPSSWQGASAATATPDPAPHVGLQAADARTLPVTGPERAVVAAGVTLAAVAGAATWAARRPDGEED